MACTAGMGVFLWMTQVARPLLRFQKDYSSKLNRQSPFGSSLSVYPLSNLIILDNFLKVFSGISAPKIGLPFSLSHKPSVLSLCERITPAVSWTDHNFQHHSNHQRKHSYPPNDNISKKCVKKGEKIIENWILLLR